MKIITIQETKNGSGYVASVNGFKLATCIANDEVTALKHLVQRLEERNSSWIQVSDWTPVDNSPTD